MTCINSPINYMGNKFKIIEELQKLFPKNMNFVDMFTGSGSIYMNVFEDCEKVYINDCITDLKLIHKELINKNTDFIDTSSKLSIEVRDSKDKYLELRNSYNKNKTPEKLLALIWSCNSNMMRFNKDLNFNQTHGKRSFNKNTQKKVDVLFDQNINNVTILKHNIFAESNDKLVEFFKRDNCFVYLDPPYINTEAGYNVFWTKELDNKLLDLMEKMVDNDILFGLSGTNNGKENKMYDRLITNEKIHAHYFGDLYQKISKSDKINQEYYLTNYNV